MAVQSLLGLSQCSHSHSWVKCYCLPTNLQKCHGCKIERREEDGTLYERKWFILKYTVFKYNIKMSIRFYTLLWVRVCLLGTQLGKKQNNPKLDFGRCAPAHGWKCQPAAYWENVYGRAQKKRVFLRKHLANPQNIEFRQSNRTMKQTQHKTFQSATLLLLNYAESGNILPNIDGMLFNG